MIQEIKQLAQALHKALVHDPKTHPKELVRFVNQYALRPTLRQRAVVASIQLSQVENYTNASTTLQKEVQAILDQVVEDIHLQNSPLDTGQPQTAVREMVAIRQKWERKIEEVYRNSPQKSVVFAGKNLYRNFYNAKSQVDFSLKNVSLELRLGEIVGLAGKNGSGKTTLLNIIAGVIAPEMGKVAYPFIDPEGSLSWRKIKSKIAYVPQGFQEWKGNLVDQIRFEAAIRGLRGEKNDLEVKYIVERFGLQPYKDKKWSEVPGGYKVRFELAKALVWRPSLLILDEPLAYLDPDARWKLLSDLQQLAKRYRNPTAVVLSTQDLMEVEGFCDQFVLLEHGAVKTQKKEGQPDPEKVMNVFEFNSGAEEKEVLQVLDSLGVLSTRHVGNRYVCKFLADVSFSEFLTQLLKAKIVFSAANDLSDSIKKDLF